ncbi:hypothetical protein GGH94_001736 [Coemansia aciculifera]|uniref:Rnh202 triple barrel domain-containing protein n=1 Tax=Coemansia aciculifera TaxID=417176 RepID=A0A9W8ITM1_9FUNG|nr:hypothetical protein GGH94_001736 [Coemansia aciculifera]KAJ2875543.1 hypothetical protein GGH93_001491 [Coemansia aciculifera]
MSDERKIVVVPIQQSGCVLQQLRLPHPHSGKPTSYYADAENEVLLEAATVDMDGRRSWLGDGWVSANGSASLMTPIDPLFIYLGLLTTMSMSSGDEWKYVDVDSLRLETNDTMDAMSVGVLLDMSRVRSRALNALCDVRDISSDMQVAKIDPTKVLSWLRRKCDPSRLPKVLESSAADMTVDAELARQARQREMALLVSEYLSLYWTTKLFAEFGGFTQVSESEQLLVKRVQAVAFDAPESYVQGVASPNGGSKLAAKQEVRS